MSDVFISYAREDRPVAKSLAHHLEEAGFEVWWDREIRTGDEFDLVIEEELRKAAAVVVLWSHESVKSTWVRAEAKRAFSSNKLIPAAVSEKVEIPLPFDNVQFSVLFDAPDIAASSGFKELISDVQTKVAGARARARPKRARKGKARRRKVHPAASVVDIFAEVQAKWLVPECEQELLDLWNDESVSAEQRERVSRFLLCQGCVDISEDVPATRSGTALALRLWANIDISLRETCPGVFELLIKEITKNATRKKIAASLSLPIDVANVLAQDSDKEIRRCLANSERASEELLEQLSLDRKSVVRAAVAANPKTPAWVLAKLAKDSSSNWDVRGNVASNSNTEPHVLEQLAEDFVESIRCSVAKNPSTPIPVLERLSKERSKHVLGCLAENVNTPVSVLVALSQSTDKSIRERVAKHTSTPTDILAKLASDSDLQVLSEVAKNKNTRFSVLAEMSAVLAGANPNVPATTLRNLAKVGDVNVRGVIAENPNAPVDLLVQLAADPEFFVRCRVAANPKTPKSILEKLARDENKAVSLWLTENPSFPEDLVDVAAAKAAKGNHIARQILARNRRTPGRVLAELAKDIEPVVRVEVARNPSTPISTLRYLVKHGRSILGAITGGANARDEVALNVNRCIEWF